jgi:hypothetical protein
MGARRSIIRQVLDRFDALMATGESRHAAKLTARAAGDQRRSVSDGRIHAFGTRKTYQAAVLRLVTERRRQNPPLRTLEELDAQAETLVARYLTARVAEGKSAWTLKMERSAFRLFFGRPELAADVPLPTRRRADITRSRRPAARDQDFAPDHWRDLLTFLDATGLRRSEAQHIHVRDVCQDAPGNWQIYVIGKGGKRRLVPTLPAGTETLTRLVAGRRPDERLFPRIPTHLDVHASRRQFAQATYVQASGGQPLPPSSPARLAPGAVDADAARHTSQALGHNRVDVTTTHYLR